MKPEDRLLASAVFAAHVATGDTIAAILVKPWDYPALREWWARDCDRDIAALAERLIRERLA